MLLMKSAEKTDIADEIRRENVGWPIDYSLHDGDNDIWVGSAVPEVGKRVIGDQGSWYLKEQT